MMKARLLIILISFASFISAAQAQQTINTKELSKQIEASKASLAETQRKIDSSINARNSKLDSISNENNIRSLNQFTLQNNAAKKRKAFQYIFMGIGFFAVLVIGLLRKRKKL